MLHVAFRPTRTMTQNKIYKMSDISRTQFKTINGVMCRWESLDDKEKVKLIKLQAQKLFKSFNKMDLSNQKFIEAGILINKGIRGGSASKKRANNELATDWYLKDLELLKSMVKTL
jgi:hypothetical protein